MTTTQFKGTKGPWVAKHGALASGIFAASNKSQIISCDQFTGWLDAEECRANANAVAAVPDMIEAGIKVLDALEGRVHSQPALSALSELRTALSRATDGEG